MSNEELKNSPLHGLSAEDMLTELVQFYDWPALDTAIDLKCFRIKPTIPACLVFLKKHEWARNRVEDFYLYTFKQMPQPSEAELELKPRERGFPDGVLPKEPRPLKKPPRPLNKKTVKRPPPERQEQEPPTSTFKSRFSDSRFRK